MIANKTGKCGGAREAESEAHLIGSRLDFRGCEERFQFCNAEVAYADTPVIKECTSVRIVLRKRKDKRRKRMSMGMEVRWV